MVKGHNIISVDNHEKNKDYLDSDEEYEETIKLTTEELSCNHSSLITNKYRENMNAPTVANKLVEMIIELESQSDIFEKQIDPDPE